MRELSEAEVAAGARRVWRWRESGEVADESAFGILFTFKDGLIHRWRQRFAGLDEAIAASEAD